jgi:hypothetical protein
MLFYILCFLASFKPAPQFGRIEGKLDFVDDIVSRQGIVVLLNIGDSVVDRTYANEQGYFQFESVPIGVYSINIKQIGYRTVSVDEVRVLEGSIVKMTIQFPHPLPCPYNYSSDFQPRCIRGHTDNIIPMVYGMPSKRTLKKAKKGKIHLSGCNVSDCDPKFYCVIHKIEF